MAKRFVKKYNPLDKIEDCYYFLYSTCKRGKNCGFRHNVLCKQCNILCDEWDSTKMCREDCPLRHSKYHLMKQREELPCFWENNGGCKKEFCEFKHEDASKDEWKKGTIRDNTKQESKNTIVNEVEMDPFVFENQRREAVARKKHLATKRHIKRKVVHDLKNVVEAMDEEQRKEFQRVLNLMESGKNARAENSRNAEALNQNIQQNKEQDDLDAELKELENLF